MLLRKAVLLALALLPMAPTFAQGVTWRKDLATAQQEASQSGKLVLLHFWSTSCGPCVALDKTVFNQPAVAKALEQQYVPVKMNADNARAMAQSYGITALPTDVILSPDNKVVRRMSCPNTPMAYLSNLSQVATSYAARSGAAYKNAADKAPYRKVVNNAYAGLGLASAEPAKPTAEAKQPAAAASAPGAIENRYASANAPAAPAKTPPAAAMNNPYATTKPPASVGGPLAGNPLAQKPAQEKPEQQLQLPPGTPPLGFEGYCTVSMKRDFKWVKGSKDWGAIHRGRLYLFSGQKERDAFMSSPDAYSPVLSGLDPIAVVEKNRAVPGKREFALQYPPQTGQFYMFSSAENRSKFATNPRGYAEGVRQAMSRDNGRMIR